MGNRIVDLFMFMGQSNMAGRGIIDANHPQPAPIVPSGVGYEYRAVSSPDQLTPLMEPFGRTEDRIGGIDDKQMKTGSMVSFFVNAYYQKTHIPVVGVSAAKGGSKIDEWQPGGVYLSDTIDRMQSAIRYLQRNNFQIRHKCMLWCQGESDGDIAKPGTHYKKDFIRMFSAMQAEGIEHCFLVRIGCYNGEDEIDYQEIQDAQEQLAQENSNITIVSRNFATMKKRGWMKDSFHYFQCAYNEVGVEAGKNSGAFWLNEQNKF